MIIDPLPSTYFLPIFWLVSEGYFARGWVNSFSLLLGQLYTGGDRLCSFGPRRGAATVSGDFRLLWTSQCSNYH